MEKNRVYIIDSIKITVYDSKDSWFYVGGRRYHGIGGLSARFRLACAEKPYPCFDTSDYIYENRYYRWFFPTKSIWEAIELSRQIKNEKIPLYQLSEPSANSTSKPYRRYPLPVVFCEDGLKHLIVVEQVDNIH